MTARQTWVTKVAGGARRAVQEYTLTVTRGPDRGKTVRVKSSRCRIGALDGNDLQLTDPADATLLVIVRRDADNPVHANVMAPLVINTATRRGLQKIIGKVDTSVTLKAIG